MQDHLVGGELAHDELVAVVSRQRQDEGGVLVRAAAQLVVAVGRQHGRHHGRLARKVLAPNLSIVQHHANTMSSNDDTTKKYNFPHNTRSSSISRVKSVIATITVPHQL